MTTGPEPSPPDAGTLRWGLKHRFLQYLAGLADGQCSVTDGASLAPGPLFVFTAADDPPDRPSGGRTVLRYRGDLRFRGHAGFLRVRIADPWLELDGSQGALTAVGIGPEPAPRRPLVTFRVQPNGPGAAFRGTDVRLTEEGSELFGDVYEVGEVFDDLAYTAPDDESARRVH
jgi:Htaa